MSENLLIDALEKLYKLHESLYELAVNKTEIIKKGDIDSLNSIMKKEQAHISAIRKMEEIRQTETVRLCAGQENPTVSDCITRLSGREQETLISVTEKLTALFNELKEQNHLNQQLIHNSLQFVNVSLNLLRPQPASINYGPSAKQGNPNEISHGLFNSQA